MKELTIDKPVRTVADRKKTRKAVGLPNESLSFGRFVKYLQEIPNGGDQLKQQYLKDALAQYVNLLNKTEDIQPLAIRELFELTDQTLSLKLTSGSFSFNLFTTPSFAELLYLKDELPGQLKETRDRDGFLECLSTQLFNQQEQLSNLCYRAIWQHFADFPCLLLPEIILSYRSATAGQRHYLKLDADFKYLLIETELSADHCRQIIEEIDATALSAAETYRQLTEKLPLGQFEFKGFGRLTVTDVTVNHMIKLIARQVVVSDQYKESFSYLKDLREALDVVAGNNNLHFGLLPMFRLNGKFIFSEHFNSENSNFEMDRASQENLYDYLINVYRLKPIRIYLKEIPDDLVRKYKYLETHKNNGVQSFALLPVFYHDRLVGVLEVHCNDARDLSKATLSRLETFFPVLSTIFEKSIHNLEQTIEEVIKTKFTTLQPSVQWRFNQAAWQYLQDTKNKPGAAEIEDIEFSGVYPLYGAVDIKNSTVNRNHALWQDAAFHLQLLTEILSGLKDKTSFALLDEKIADCKKWQKLIADESCELAEGELDYFFENEIFNFLRELAQAKPEIIEDTERYFKAISEEDGTVTTKRRMLESSMGTVIGAINELIDEIGLQAQLDFPCFFEKFRTDGVEYDIYIGQSISPDKPFNHIFIKNLRLLQLTNMIAIAKRVHELQPGLPVAVEITQLIFVNPNVIDIRFRRDERRFDVEGAYNIRYHIVKKRIDKVLIKNTTERLTSPGKIAIVYTNQREAHEYLVHIRYLQSQGLLTEEIEHLELEQLQGVIGLKALRVAVR